MTSHELARYLLEKTPDVKVVINGWGSDEGFAPFEVSGAALDADGSELSLGYVSYDGEWCLTMPKL